jgi:threonine/homoserine/homoserine lactone efflux protein
MISLHQALGLAAASFVLIVIPGPSVLFVVGRALSYGRRTALASVVGNTTGCVIGAALICLGLGQLVQRSELAFMTIKLLGALYLVWLGVHALRSGGEGPAEATGVAPPTASRAIRTGIVVGVTNPKLFILMAAVLPQFVEPGTGHVTGQLLLLALIPLTIGLFSDSAWAVAAGTARDWLTSRPGRLRSLGRAGGLCMIGLGVTVALTGGPE